MTPTLIVTRPAAQGEGFAARIASQWGRPLEVIQSPLIAIVPIAVDAADVDEVIFTSVNGVTASAGTGLRKGLRAWCVGDRTAQAAKAAGFVPVVGPGNGDGLVDALHVAKPAGKLGHIRGRHARGDICAGLRAAGLQCRDIVAYDQQALDLSAGARAALDGQKPVVLPLFSPRTCTILFEQGPFSAPLHIIALSEAVAAATDPAHAAQIIVASSPDGTAMDDAVLKELDVVANSAE